MLLFFELTAHTLTENHPEYAGTLPGQSTGMKNWCSWKQFVIS